MIDATTKNHEEYKFSDNFNEFIIPKNSRLMNNKQKLNKIDMKKKIYWNEKYYFRVTEVIK